MKRTVLPSLQKTLFFFVLSAGILTTQAQEDDDSGAPAPTPVADDDFGTPPASAADDDFGAPAMAPGEGDDDFGAQANELRNYLVSSDEADGTDDADEEEDLPYSTAAEAHLTFLKALESENRFPSAATCAECHPDHYREWSVSAHAYAQMSPVFNTMHAAIVERTAGTNGDFCIRCHTQIGMQRDEPLFTSNLNRHPASIEGITCVVCHRVNQDYGKVSGRTHIQQGDIFTTMFGPTGSEILNETLEVPELQNKLNIQAEDENGERPTGKKHLHAEIERFDPIATSGFCGACHDVNLLNGFRLEEAFTQYKNSPAAEQEQSCQDCHMGTIPGAVVPGIDKREDPDAFNLANYDRGPGARIGGDIWAVEGDESTGNWGYATRERKRTNHMFAGPDYSIIHPGIFPHSQDLREALWNYEQETDEGTIERVGLKHLIEFQYEQGWGDPESAFEKSLLENPDAEKALPWPWNDPIARQTMAEKLNSNFRLLNDIHQQRVQILRRGVQLHEFEVTRNDNRRLDFRVKVVNGTDGHGVPTGFDAERLAFLEVTVTDANGNTIFVSGDRDPNGDVRDLHSSYVHAQAPKSGSWLAEAEWKQQHGLPLQRTDTHWDIDPYLFNLQSKFITRSHRGGEREQVLAVNYSIDPLPYIRPDTTPGILIARPGAARKHARGLPPGEFRWAEYEVDRNQLTGATPYEVDVRFIWQMVPVNLIKEISDQGFDYNLSPAEVARRVAFGHQIPGGEGLDDRRGGAITTWRQSATIEGSEMSLSWVPSEEDIMAAPEDPFPYRDPADFAGGGLDAAPGAGLGGIDYGGLEDVQLPDLPRMEGVANPGLLIPKPEGNDDDDFGGSAPEKPATDDDFGGESTEDDSFE